MSKYLQSFETKTDYNKAVLAGQIPTPSVCLVEGKVYYKPIIHTNVGDIFTYNRKTGEYKFTTLNAWPTMKIHADEVPIGVVVVPSSHTPDNTSRICSLMDMSLKNPESGIGTSSSTGTLGDNCMYWGGNGVDLSLKDYTSVVTVDTASDSLNQTVGSNSWTRISGDPYANSDRVDPLDKNAGWWGTQDTHGPSPFLTDGTRNPLYLTKSNNCLIDFDGKGNTGIIMAAQTLDWSGNTLTDSYAAGNYPAASVCRRYHTEGTNAGDWYLPAVGEAAYMWSRRNLINKSFSAIGGNIASLNGGAWYWTSTEYNSSDARYVTLYGGDVSYFGKSGEDAGNRVKSFLAY